MIFHKNIRNDFFSHLIQAKQRTLWRNEKDEQSWKSNGSEQSEKSMYVSLQKFLSTKTFY